MSPSFRTRWASCALAAVLGLTAASPTTAQVTPSADPPPAFSLAEDLPPEARQFDFWVGTWDVNLRIQQGDASWQDSIRSEARVYPILRGKAVLELWDSAPIKGFSLRHFDTAKDKWVLWLNWPSNNRANTGSLEGAFRHGRGEFFSSSTRPDGTTSMSRYSFSDITADSLRWDDAFSSDGGKTWTNSWIMEFSRTAAQPELPFEGGPAHTYIDGGRCDDERFRRYEFVDGAWDGEVTVGERRVPVPARLVAHKVLDGCAVLMSLTYELDGEPHEVFHHLTFNAGSGRYELLVLDDEPHSPAALATSAVSPDELRCESTSGQRFLLSPVAEGFVYEADRRRDDGSGWDRVAQARFTR
jgi:hypothetical protein